MADTFIHMIPAYGAANLAKLYGPLLARSFAAAGETDARACMVDLIAGRRQIWGVFRVNRAGPLALFRTEIIIEADGSRWLCVSGLAGNGLHEWARMLADKLAMVAKNWDCKCVRFAGRQAWGRVLPEFKPISTLEGETIFQREAAP